MAKIPILQGEKILLREILERDVDDRLAIGRHHEFEHNCGGPSLFEVKYPTRDVWERWYQSAKDDPFLWVIEVDGRCVGTAGFHHVSEEDRSAVYRIGIFDPACHSKGYGTEATTLLLRYAFGEMHWHRVELQVLDYNRRAIRCYEKCGFRVDGILRENAYIDGQYYSDVVMSVLEEEYWADEKNGKKNKGEN